MSREIKFRIWTGEKMVFGPTDNNPNSSWVLALASTVEYPPQQYTGIKDKYGTDIYEGDIVRIVKEYPYGIKTMQREIAWASKGGWHPIGTLCDNLHEYLHDVNGKNCSEVVGHIYKTLN